jgi:hypothetical protein
VNPQLLNADAVMTAVRQGQAPATWQVYRGRVAFHVRQLLGGLLILLLGFVGVMYLLLNPDTVIVPGSGQSGTLDTGPFAIARIGDFVVLAVVQVVGLGLCVSSSSQLTTVRDQALVLLPEGFVIGAKKPTAYAFAAMQAIAARNNRGTITFSVTPSGGDRRQTFRLNSRFGDAKHIATQILAARTAWQRANSAAQSPQPPMAGPAQ